MTISANHHRKVTLAFQHVGADELAAGHSQGSEVGGETQPDRVCDSPTERFLAGTPERLLSGAEASLSTRIGNDRSPPAADIRTATAIAERTSAFEWRRGGLERPQWARSGRSAARSGTSANDPKRTRRCGLAQTEPYCLLRRLAETVAICHFEPAGVGKTVAPRDLGDRDPCCTAIELGV